MRIQIIDDDTALCRSLQIQLEREGHEVALSHTGRRAWRRFATPLPISCFST